MDADFNPHLQAAISEAVENQIANNTPPETHQTYKRLLREGPSQDDAKKLIAGVVAVEIFEVVNWGLTLSKTIGLVLFIVT